MTETLRTVFNGFWNLFGSSNDPFIVVLTGVVIIFVAYVIVRILSR